TVNLDSLPCDGEQNASGTTGNLQDRSARTFRELKVKRQIYEVWLGGVGAVVILGRDLVGIDGVPHCRASWRPAPSKPPQAFSTWPTRANSSRSGRLRDQRGGNRVRS